MLFSKDPLDLSYYIPVILCVCLIVISLEFFLKFVKSKMSADEKADDATLFQNINYSLTLADRKDSLWCRYMSGYIISRCSMWAKSPYMYLLYSTLHGFNVGEIGVLYAIDAISGLVFGILIGSLADIYGRKKFSILYNILVIINLYLRLTGIRKLAYVAQVLTGLGAGIINTSFEAWLIFESSKEFKDKEQEKDKFLKRLFKSQSLLDSTCSILTSVVCAIAFNYFGIIAPVLISMILCLISTLIICFTWDENNPASSVSNSNVLSVYKEALHELFTKRDILTVGITESLYQAVLNIFIFAWTPILQRSTTSGSFNPGMCFITFVLMIILGAKIYEICIIHYKLNLYFSISVCLIVEALSFMLIYYEDYFYIRFILCAVINGICGFYLPANSAIKATILPEKYRTTLMSIFRIPLNVYVIATLLYIKSMDPFNICILCLIMLIIAFLGSISLYLFPKYNKPDTDEVFNPSTNFVDFSLEPNTFERGDTLTYLTKSKYETIQY